MSSKSTTTDHRVGPLLGFVLAAILGAALIFSAWKFLQGPGPEAQTTRTTAQQASSRQPPSHEALETDGPQRIDDSAGRGKAVIAPQASSAPTLQIDAIERRNRGLDPNVKLFNLVGRIVDRDTGDGVLSTELFVIPKAAGDPLKAMEKLRPQRFRNSSGKGDFTHRYIVAGSYNLVVRTTTHETFVRPGGIDIPYEESVLIELERGTWIDGVVRDNYGKPIAKKKIHLQPQQLDPGYRPPQRRLVESNNLGYFAFYKLPPGRYEMIVGVPADPDAKHPEFYLGEGQHLDRSFAVDRQVTLKFLLANADGNPVRRARVQVRAVGDNAAAMHSVLSDYRGEARLEFVKPGEYSLSIKAPGYRPLEEPSYFVHHGDFLVNEKRTLNLSLASDR